MPVEVVALVVEGSVLVADVVELAEVVAVTAACVIDNPFPEVMFKFCINAHTYIGKIFDSVLEFSPRKAMSYHWKSRMLYLWVNQ